VGRFGSDRSIPERWNDLLGEQPRRHARVAAEELDREHRAAQRPVSLDAFDHLVGRTPDAVFFEAAAHVAAVDLLGLLERRLRSGRVFGDDDDALLRDLDRIEVAIEFVAAPPQRVDLGGELALEDCEVVPDVRVARGDPHQHALAAAADTVVRATGENHSLEVLLMLLSVAVGLAGIGTAWFLYNKKPALPAKITAGFGGLYKLVFNKYYIDELYEYTIVRPGYFLSDKLMFRLVDTGIIEGIVNGVGIMARLIGSTVRLAQSGVVRTYAFFFLIGFLYLLYTLLK